MLFTKYDFEKFKNDPFKLLEEIKQNINNDDTKMIFAREPVTEDYHREEGMFFIHNKLINLEELMIIYKNKFTRLNIYYLFYAIIATAITNKRG